MGIEDIRELLQSKYPEMEAVSIRHEDIVFEERVRLKCFHCKNYRTKWTCPGHLPPLDFRRVLNEYEHLAVIVSGKVPQSEYKQSGNDLHKAMLYLESELLKRNEPLAQSFIGGACEWCENGCNADACAHPDKARIPWDAIGCNVTASLAHIGIQVDFAGDTITRYGLLAW